MATMKTLLQEIEELHYWQDIFDGLDVEVDIMCRDAVLALVNKYDSKVQLIMAGIQNFTELAKEL